MMLGPGSSGDGIQAVSLKLSRHDYDSSDAPPTNPILLAVPHHTRRLHVTEQYKGGDPFHHAPH